MVAGWGSARGSGGARVRVAARTRALGARGRELSPTAVWTSQRLVGQQETRLRYYGRIGAPQPVPPKCIAPAIGCAWLRSATLLQRTTPCIDREWCSQSRRFWHASAMTLTSEQ